MVTFTISTYNNLEYLKLAIKSVRENAYYKDAPFIIHTENCTDGTNEWLFSVKDFYNLELYIEPEVKPARGIGGGMNISISKVKTKYVIPIQSDFFVGYHFDLALIEELKKCKGRAIVSSWRIQPNIFGNPPQKPGNLFLPLNTFGAYWNDFDYTTFTEYSREFCEKNAIIIRRAEGAGGYALKKDDWDYVGGNDSVFAPTSWEDMDLFIRMQNLGFEIKQTSKSLIWHFAGRGSHRLEENGGQTCQRQREAEQRNFLKFQLKWGQLPQFDENDFVKPIPSKYNRMEYNIETNTSKFVE